LTSRPSHNRLLNCLIDQNDEDIPYEEDVIRNQYSVKHWLRYIEHKLQRPNTKASSVFMLYERSLKCLPGSYKLWIRYLKYRRESIVDQLMTSAQYRDLNNCYERSLVFMHKMPRIWIDYCRLLIEQCLITRARRTLDRYVFNTLIKPKLHLTFLIHSAHRAIQALPITQHSRIWEVYMELIKTFDIPETAVRLYKRYMKLQPEDAEDFVEYLLQINRVDEAAGILVNLVNREDFISKAGKSKHQLWSELCELISKNPDKVHSINVHAIIKEGINRYKDQQGKLWNSLAEYYIRDGQFDRARDVFEEAIGAVITIRDFSQVFDAYALSEERIVNTMLENQDEDEEDVEVDIRLARLEHLMERRPVLVNSVALRQNPHNVEEWLKRVSLLTGRPLEIIETFTTAVETVDDRQAIGKLSSIWIQFACFYEQHNQPDEARTIFEQAVLADYGKVEDLAAVWCEYAELELRNGRPELALQVMKRATAMPAKVKPIEGESSEVGSIAVATDKTQQRVYRSLRVWCLYADLEESFGTFESTRAVYERIIELKIATPQIVINYGRFLEQHKYFEEAFKAYEKGVHLFRWPVVFDIWNTYLAKFLNRYGGSKLERARDLFEQCLEQCPAQYSRNIYFLYAKLEEDHGLAKHAMSIYERATESVASGDVFDVYNVYIHKATEMFGLTYTRGIYEQAIERLPDDQARQMCIRFADLERKLGEIDRSRAIYAHCSGLSDPRTADGEAFWRIWKEFEIKHGNEDTIREMLRIKRSVQATYNTQVNLSSQMIVGGAAAAGGFVKGATLDEERSSKVTEDPAKENASDNVLPI
jgi:pre-mRNA-splicing factor SYF1